MDGTLEQNTLTNATTINALTYSICYRDTLLGHVIAHSVNLPRIVWYTKSGIGFAKRDFYLLYFSLGYYVEYALSLVLQEYFNELRPNPACSNDEFGFPSFESQISYMFVGFIVGHLVLWHERMKLASWLYVVILAVYVPFVLTYNGMNTVLQVLAGALVGIIGGFVRVYVYKYYIHPYVPILLQFKLFAMLAYKNTYFKKAAKERLRRQEQETLELVKTSNRHSEV